ncbi:hypothetical protein NDU88_006254 [Pleurodeles waltl]|uniref:Uncharacterized protein n=1 Tax=Pleurodeles waltl TaxID=8319 RepID=A0AAV7PI41_PLEWA|nr:hypothetical protein NDU88_006254 [Pleurodeles waltl]
MEGDAWLAQIPCSVRQGQMIKEREGGQKKDRRLTGLEKRFYGHAGRIEKRSICDEITGLIALSSTH